MSATQMKHTQLPWLGYTHPVADGEITTLRQFALLCARAFGATITMRDDPLDVEIPERFKPNTDYYDKGLASAKERLAALTAMTDEECEAASVEEYQRLVSEQLDYAKRRIDANDRLSRMLDAVKAWEIGEELAGLKTFMSEQLSISIWKHEPSTIVQLGPKKWRLAAIKSAQRDIEYHDKGRADEIERTENRNRWLAALRASLPAEQP